MRFAHFSDVHLGSWNSHPDLRNFSVWVFDHAINKCISEKIDFIVIAGDFFDTSIPPIDIIRNATAILRKCKEAGIPIYMIAGSHDYSPTGKTMLSVMEEAGLVCNVNNKVVKDEKTKSIIFGVEGLKGGLDHTTFEKLKIDDIGKEYFKIFLLHTAIAEHVNIPMIDSIPLSKIPKGFDYYANGHIHHPLIREESTHGIFAQPGSLFPVNFHELENFGQGGFYFVQVDEKKVHSEMASSRLNYEIRYQWTPVRLVETELIEINANDKKPGQVEDELIRKIEETDLNGKLILLKIHGIMVSGKASDINIKAAIQLAEDKGARSIKRSIKIESKEMNKLKITTSYASIDELEQELIKQSIGNMETGIPISEKDLIIKLMAALEDSRREGETIGTFEERIRTNIKAVVDL